VSDPELIRASIEASGLSARRFAERIMARDERTLRRWSAGDTEIPPVARRWLEDWLALSAAARLRVVKALDI
jgi:ribosome-binding protein aMBF1 (putative translation factor)